MGDLGVTSERGLKVFMLSLHGLVRGHDLELGRDADTGGQVTYVVELARALGRSRRVAQVDLLTRLVEDPAVSPDYARPHEELGPGARIVRLPFGPRRYLRKELLWPHLEGLTLRCLGLFETGFWKVPDVIHSHYGDAGWVGARLARALNVPLVHTGHSLGILKKRRLIEAGRKESALERQFHFERRIEAEEEAFRQARLVVTSTRQEIEEQWACYAGFDAAKCLVIPPGIDAERFGPSSRWGIGDSAWVDRFLARPGLPMVLAVCRPAPKKNIGRLVQAYGEDPALQRMANLVIVAGTREDIRAADEDVREVLTEMLLLIDRYDLWGKVAIPKSHVPEQIPELYRLAARRRGVFVNPAVTEPFGLTLLEAAASGLPIVATEHGGPREIVERCGNGLLVDPLDTRAIAAALRDALSDAERWRAWSKNGVAGVARTYTWGSHVASLLSEATRLRSVRREPALGDRRRAARPFRWLLLTDIDDTLIGDRDALARLLGWLEGRRAEVGFGVATGRSLPQALGGLSEWGVPLPDVIVASVGTEVYWGSDLVRDAGWRQHISQGWDRGAVAEALAGIPGLEPQPADCQGELKVSFYIDANPAAAAAAARHRLRSRLLRARLVASQGRFLDVLPMRASKRLATRFLARRSGVPLARVLVAGDSGNDLDMLAGETYGVVVGNHKPELLALRGRPRVHFAAGCYADGILDGIRRWRFGPPLSFPPEAASA